MTIATQFINRRRLILKTITDVIREVKTVRIVVDDAGDIQYEQVFLADVPSDFLEKNPNSDDRVQVTNRPFVEDDITHYCVRCEVEDPVLVCILYYGNIPRIADGAIPTQTLYPTFSITSDPEVVADISLAGNRLQRFFPILIQGFISLQNELDLAELAAGDEKENRRAAAYLLGEAYADSIVASLTTTENSNAFNSAFGEGCFGFALERIGPVIVDNFTAHDNTDRALISVQVQTSFIQDS